MLQLWRERNHGSQGIPTALFQRGLCPQQSFTSFLPNPSVPTLLHQGRSSPAKLAQLCSAPKKCYSSAQLPQSLTCCSSKGKFPQPKCYSSALFLLRSAPLWWELLQLCSAKGVSQQRCSSSALLCSGVCGGSSYNKPHSRHLLGGRNPGEWLLLSG